MPQILGLILVVINYLLTVHGFGHHQTTISMQNAVLIQKTAFFAPLTYQLAIAAVKISICFFNLRIFQDDTSRRISYAFMALVTAYTIALFFVSLLGCVPISDFWSLTPPPPGHCISDDGRIIVIYTSGAINIATDLLLLLFVVPRISTNWQILQN